MMQILPPVRRYLINRHIHVPDDWLTACIDWVLEEYSQHNVPFVQGKVYQEWLHADLKELGASCLPSQVQDEAATTIVGHFTLQVNSVRDVSEPAYAQLLKVEGVDTENSTISATQNRRPEQEKKANRMLMLELTDGTTVVEGMEYKPIPNLNINVLSPGTKVRVFGSIKVCRRILFLNEHNITVLGGKVMDLLEANNQTNILSAALNIQGTDPRIQQQQRINNGNNIQPGSLPEPQTHPNNTSEGTGGTRSQNDSGISTAQPTTHDEEELDFFDDDLFENELDQDMTLESEAVQDPAVEHEFEQDLALEDEFDKDLDAFMSQM